MKYYPMIMSLPYSQETDTEFLRDENGDMTDTWGIVILTRENIDQDKLPPEYRIPDSLEGVPVQILPREIGYPERLWYPQFDPEIGNPHSHVRADVDRKNWDLFRRYPFFSRTNSYTADRGEDPFKSNSLDRIFGIEVFVTEKVDPSTLPWEDRIPDCLEDVPVRIRVE